MSETNEGGMPAMVTAAPAVAPAPVAPQAPTATQLPTEGEPDVGSPEWLNPRLSKAKAAAERRLLDQFGVEKPEDLQARLKRLDELEAASLTEQERQAKQIEELTTRATESETYKRKFTDMVNSRFDALPEAQRESIDAEAAGDAAQRFTFMKVMGLMGTGPVAPAPQPQPASTTPATAPKPPAPSGAAQTAYERWKALDANQQTRAQAAIFRQANALEVERTRPSS